MRNRKEFTMAAFLYTGFLAAIGLGMLLLNNTSDHYRVAAEFFYFFLGLGLFGILAPLLVSRRFHIPYDEQSDPRRLLTGMVFFILAVAAEIAYSLSWIRIIELNPGALIRLKHVLVTLPLAGGLALVLFIIIPKALEEQFGRSRIVFLAETLLPAAGLGFLMYMESGFADRGLGLAMAGIGALIGLGHVFTRKFFLTYLSLYLCLYSGALAAGRYSSFSWEMTIAGVLFCAAALFLGLKKKDESSHGETSCPHEPGMRKHLRRRIHTR